MKRIYIADLLKCLDPNQTISLWAPYWDEALEDVEIKTYYQGPAQQLPVEYQSYNLAEWNVCNGIIHLWPSFPCALLCDPRPITIGIFLRCQEDEPSSDSIRIVVLDRGVSISKPNAKYKFPYRIYLVEKVRVIENNEITIYVRPSNSSKHIERRIHGPRKFEG